MKIKNKVGKEIEHGDIPDLWHIGQHLLEDKSPQMRAQGQAVIDTWHFAHDMKDVIEGRATVVGMEHMIAGQPE